MPRKPFEPLKAYGDFNVPSLALVMLETANAAIAQDKEYALTRAKEWGAKEATLESDLADAKAEIERLKSDLTYAKARLIELGDF